MCDRKAASLRAANEPLPGFRPEPAPGTGYFSDRSGRQPKPGTAPAAGHCPSLKDAAASIYGVRASNGVLLVSTKHGSAENGKFDITFSFNYGWQNFLYTPETADAATHMLLMNEKALNTNFGGNYFIRQSPLYSWERMLEYSSSHT